jgi:hypothetical protein
MPNRQYSCFIQPGLPWNEPTRLDRSRGALLRECARSGHDEPTDIGLMEGGGFRPTAACKERRGELPVRGTLLCGRVQCGRTAWVGLDWIGLGWGGEGREDALRAWKRGAKESGRGSTRGMHGRGANGRWAAGLDVEVDVEVGGDPWKGMEGGGGRWQCDSRGRNTVWRLGRSRSPHTGTEWRDVMIYESEAEVNGISLGSSMDVRGAHSAAHGNGTREK